MLSQRRRHSLYNNRHSTWILNGLLRGGPKFFQFNVFFKHGIQDSSIYGETFLNGQPHWVYRSWTLPCFVSATYAQDIGIISASGFQRITQVCLSVGNLQIKEFNGMKIGGFVTTSLKGRSKTMKHSPELYIKKRNYKIILGTDRNVIGQQINTFEK